MKGSESPSVLRERACVFKDRARTHTFSSLSPLPCLGPCEAKHCRTVALFLIIS